MVMESERGGDRVMMVTREGRQWSDSEWVSGGRRGEWVREEESG